MKLERVLYTLRKKYIETDHINKLLRMSSPDQVVSLCKYLMLQVESEEDDMSKERMGYLIY